MDRMALQGPGTFTGTFTGKANITKEVSDRINRMDRMVLCLVARVWVLEFWILDFGPNLLRRQNTEGARI